MTAAEVFKKFALIDKRSNFDKKQTEPIISVRKYEETPLEKFERINNELQEFKKELEFSQQKVENLYQSLLFIKYI